MEFGNQIVLFGAALLLSVLPMIILFGALANSQIDDDISRHLGLNAQGARIVDGLFRSRPLSFSFAIAIAFVLSLAGTIGVAVSVQKIYENALALPHRGGVKSLLRSCAWVLCAAAFLTLDAAASGPIRNGPAGTFMLGLVTFLVVTLFFWWSMHFLLGGREPWRRLWPSALATGLFWIGLGVFGSFYFSSTVISDNKLYGTIGVVFDLVTWFIATGAVITLGAVVGTVWQRRRH